MIGPLTFLNICKILNIVALRVQQIVSMKSFHVLDHTFTSFQLMIKEAIYIQREQPSLNQQLHSVNLKLSL